jgi:hypothetical protein
VAIIDDDGCFSIVDRVKELINYKRQLCACVKDRCRAVLAARAPPS